MVSVFVLIAVVAMTYVAVSHAIDAAGGKTQPGGVATTAPGTGSSAGTVPGSGMAPAPGATTGGGVGSGPTPSPVKPTGPKHIEVQIDDKTATAIVHEYVGDTEVAVFQGKSGGPGDETPAGDFKITGHLGTIHTGLYKATLGHEFFLKYFLQFQGDYGFHTYKVNDATMKTEVEATHGCIALAEADAKSLYEWAADGTTVHIVAN